MAMWPCRPERVRSSKTVATRPMSLTTVTVSPSAHRHAGRLLAAVLQGEESVEGEVGHPRPGRVDPEDTAGFLHALHSRTGPRAQAPPGLARFPSGSAGPREGGRPARPHKSVAPGRPEHRRGIPAPRPGRTAPPARRWPSRSARALAEELGRIAERSTRQPTPAATAISASATARPPDDRRARAWTSFVTPPPPGAAPVRPRSRTPG